MNTEKIFALDIGTRSIVGLILSTNQEDYYVEDMIQKEHKERAMLDGQIHNVPAVAELVLEIKEELEKTHGPLTKVSVAAAGRALKTNQACFSFPLEGKPRLTAQDILHMELSAVQSAQEAAASQDEYSHHYHCVGYSVLHYSLDGQEIGSLVDQQGDEAAVEIIATFLPRVVIESLIASLKRANLQMGALTLEPIAAINVLIPPSMRRLNVALVDIGAGTSDIAITNHGTVVAYGMVPVAGDEMTERISDHYLLDFPQAEYAKRTISTSETVSITDILGFDTEIPQAEITEVLRPSVERLAQTISEEIMNLNNQRTPKAIMLVGGGSLTPLLPQILAEKLQLPSNRVAVRGNEAIQQLTFHESIKKGPELVTPVGIAIAAKKSPVNYVSVTVNKHDIRLFEVKELSVGDALLAAGIKLTRLYGKPGFARMITVNGQVLTIPGEHGHPPILKKNGENSTLEESIEQGDVISITPGQDGQSHSISIQDVLEESLHTSCHVNDQLVAFKKEIFVNGQIESPMYIVQDRDQIQIQKGLTLRDVCHHIGVIFDDQSNKQFMLAIDGKQIFFPHWDMHVYVNGRETKKEQLSLEVKQNDLIRVQPATIPSVKQLLEQLHYHLEQKVVVTFNGDEVELKDPHVTVNKNGDMLTQKDSLHYGDEIQTSIKETLEYTFQDIFRFIDWRPPNDPSGEIIMLKNGVKTSLTDLIQTGDKLELYIK
ncbi:pilus assembly protein PilM [Jeotgalibacillus marinus]|uniref:Pilus assembly protein PilM n=1 Tax=Jeotgalibacillus marinus TaxID=86667 RepID=A0ABV3Q097_9BACL